MDQFQLSDRSHLRARLRLNQLYIHMSATNCLLERTLVWPVNAGECDHWSVLV